MDSVNDLTEEQLAAMEPNLRKGMKAAMRGREASDQAFDEMFPEKTQADPATP
jgi:hypothetical protein